MNKIIVKRFRKFNALIMIYLVISLTFFSAFVFARLDYTISGSQGIEEFVSEENDAILLNVTADSQVSFVIGGDLVELPCIVENSTGYYICSYMIDNTLTSGVYDFTLSQINGIPSTKTGQLIIDGVAPTVNFLSEPEVNNGKLEVEYTVEDKAYDNLQGVCSGLDKIDFYLDGGLVETLNLTTNPNDCIISGMSASFDIPEVEGNVSFYAIAFDNLFNFQQSESITTYVDTMPPQIQQPLKIMMGENNVTMISTAYPSANPVSIIVMAVEENQIQEARADLSSLNVMPIYASQYSNKLGICILVNDMYECNFGNNIILQPSSGDISIDVTLRDNYGNNATETLSLSLDIVNSAGSITYFGPEHDHCDDTTCYIKAGPNTIILEIPDAGTTYYEANIMFDFSQTGAPYPNVQPEECVLNDTTWKCTTRLFGSSADNSGTSYTIFLINPSTDDYGNPVSGITSASLILDTEPPVNSTNLNASLVCPIAGETIELHLKVSDDLSSALKIYADVDNISSIVHHENECVPLGNKEFNCTLEIDDFVSYAITETADVIVEDLAGNKMTIPYTFEVCQANTEAVPNYITDITVDTLPIIDKRIATFMPFKTFLPFSVGVQDAQILSVQDINCGGTTYLSGTPYIINEYELSSDPEEAILVVPIKGSIVNGQPELLPDIIEINCTIDFRMRKGSVVFVQPEPELLFVEIPTTEVELGNIDDSVYKKINNEKEIVKGLRKTIDNYGKINNIIGMLCGIAELMGKINSVLQAVKSVIYGICVAISWTGAGEPIWQAVGPILNKIHTSFIEKYIWPTGNSIANMIFLISGDTSNWIGTMVKFICNIYNCALYDGGTYTSFGISWTMGDLSTGTISASTSTSLYDIQEVLPHGSILSIPSSMLQSNDARLDGPMAVYDVTARAAEESEGSDYSGPPSEQVFMDSININDWIINPYASKHFDALCLPAIEYNAKKEEQIRCAYIQCLESHAELGLPIQPCDKMFSGQYCLYVESAMYRLNKGNVWRAILDGMIKYVSNNLFGLASTIAFRILCKEYLKNMYTTESLATGWKSSLCGLTGAAIGLQEILAVFQDRNFFTAYTPQSERFENDQCEGINLD